MLALRAQERERQRERERERQRHPRSDLVRLNATLRANNNPMEVFNDRAIIERYRLPREAIRQLLEATGEDLRRSTRRSFALTAETQLLAALRFFATGSFLQVVGDGHGLCKASVSRSVQAVTDCLLRLVPEHLTFPTREEMTGIQGHFSARTIFRR